MDGPALDVLRRGLLVDGSPSRLNTRPRHSSPTGTLIGSPVSTASVPRTRPSVAAMAMQRTTLSPMCWATSTISFLPLFPVQRVQKGGQFTVPESDVQYRSHDLYDLSDVFFWHSTHSFSGLFL